MSMRSVMCYGEHTGVMLAGGGTEGGESFDAEDITVEGTRTLNPAGAAYLFGHPSHRGRIRNVKCNHNSMETALTAIEPNFNLDGYEVIGNVIKSDGEAIHCWRYSRNGTVADNLRVHDTTGKPVVRVNAPRGWRAPEPPIQRNNRNQLSAGTGGEPPKPPPSWILTFRYGGGSPDDAGPLGHCIATLTSDGAVRIASMKRRQATPMIVFETQALNREKLEAISRAADAALREPPFSRRGANEDGMFLRLQREGDRAARVDHNQMSEYADTPPQMQAFVGLLNELLPDGERIPLNQRTRSESTSPVR